MTKPHQQHIRRLVLDNFRSYGSARIDLSGRHVAFTGANGAGKTNILEALSLLGAGRGLRHARTEDLARQGGPGGWSIAVALQNEMDEPIKLGVGFAAGGSKKSCRVDGKTLSGPGALRTYLRFLWLSPAQDRLFMESAGERRRFLDRMTLAYDPAHGQMAGLYEKALKHRLALLESPKADASLLAIIERQIAEAGTAIAAARREMAARLMARTGLTENAAFPIADIALQGTLETALADRPAGEVEEAFIARLHHSRARDKDAGRMLEGPHRSDMIVSHREKNQLARLCSTGEQKALLIGLVLANAVSLAADPDAPPLILLLDEIAAHLDAARRAALFDILNETQLQAFATGTDAALFHAWGAHADHFEIRNGAFEPYETP